MNSKRSHLSHPTASKLFSLLFLIAAVPSAFAAVLRPDNLVAWYRAEVNSGDQLGGHHATDIGLAYTTGKVGKAFVLDAAGDKASIPNNAAFQKQNFTIEAWIKRANATSPAFGLNTYAMIFSYGSGGYGLGMADSDSGQPNGELFLWKVDEPVILRLAGAVITDTVFHHVAVTKSGEKVACYIDGALASSQETEDVYTFTTDLAVGNFGDAFPYAFDGLIDEMSFYDRPLSAAEIAALYADGSDGKATLIVNSSVQAANGPDNVFSLREAITVANFSNDHDKIGFDIPTPPLGEVSRYSAEGATSNVTPDSISGFNGTMTNGATFAPGKVGLAFDLDGADDRVEIAHNAAQNLGSAISISAWIRPDTLPGIPDYDVLLQKLDFLTGYILAILPNGTLSFIYSIGGSLKSTDSPSATIATGAWQHLAATYDGTTVRLYLNGQQIMSKAQTGAIDAVTVPLVFGSDPSTPGLAFDGKIDEVELFSRALEASEIRSIYEHGLAMNAQTAPAGLIAQYRAEGNGRDSVGTRHGNPLNGAATGRGPLLDAFQLDGVDDLVSTASSNWGFANDGTIAAWIKTHDLDGTIASLAHPTAQDEIMILVSDGKAMILSSKSVGNFTRRASASRIDTGDWVFVAGGLDGGNDVQNLRIFVNGVEETGTVASVGAPAAIVDTAQRNLIIGSRNTLASSDFFAGAIDNVMVFDHSLTPAEIHDLYLDGLAAMSTPHTIAVRNGDGELPEISTNVVIDGYTQRGAHPNTNPVGIGLNTDLKIELSGGSDEPYGLRLVSPAANSVIRGLAISGFGHTLVSLNNAHGNRIEGNFIGVDRTGTSLPPVDEIADGFDLFQSLGNTIGGATPAARNLISGVTTGVVVDNNSSPGNAILGNIIGLNSAGTAALARPGAAVGILLQNTTETKVGGAAPGEGNVISGIHGAAIQLRADSYNNLIRGNYIGTRADGTGNLGNNGPGVSIDASESNWVGGEMPGEGNRIRNNVGDGVFVGAGLASYNRIIGNSIFNNGGLGIDLNPNGVTPTPNRPAARRAESAVGANNSQPYPLLTDVKTTSTIKVSGTVSGFLPFFAHRIDFYASPTADATGYGEGRDYLGSKAITTSGSGAASFSAWFPFVGRNFVITATATDGNGNTSEFSKAIAVPGDNAADAAWKRYP